MHSKKKTLVLSVCLSLIIGSLLYSCAPNIQRTGAEGLNSVLNNRDVIVVDVRSPRDWNASDEKIKGALRGDPLHIDSWAASLPKDKTIVLYCA